MDLNVGAGLFAVCMHGVSMHYVCMCVCMYVCVYVCICMYDMTVCVYVCMYVCMYMYLI